MKDGFYWVATSGAVTIWQWRDGLWWEAGSVAPVIQECVVLTGPLDPSACGVGAAAAMAAIQALGKAA